MLRHERVDDRFGWVGALSRGAAMRVTAAAAWHAGDPVEITDVDLDDPRPDEILVRVEAVGICHSDPQAMNGHLPGISCRIILGHEGVGTFERVGSAVTRVDAGDRACC